MSITAIVTPAWVKANMLFGVDLTNDRGEEYPDSLFQLSIDSAIDQVAAELGVVLSGLVTFTERHDVKDDSYLSFYYLQMRKRPVRAVTSVSYKLGNWSASSLPIGDVHIASDVGGILQIIPGPDAHGFASLTNLPFSIHARDYTPLWWEVTYQAGFDGTTYPFDPMLLEAVGIMASMLALDTAGDLIAGAGIASQSISMDGLSTSINTTASATNSGYGARAIQYRKRYETIIQLLKARYRAPMAFAV